MSKTKRTLPALADKIECEAKKGDERLLATAKLLLELKCRLQAGEAGEGVKWTQWCQERFGRGKTWLYDLVAIASAPDPKKALDAYHKKNCERQKRYNEKVAERDPERAAVIKLLREIDIEYVRKVRKLICALAHV
jgi:hypothetical protein